VTLLVHSNQAHPGGAGGGHKGPGGNQGPPGGQGQNNFGGPKGAHQGGPPGVGSNFGGKNKD